MSNVVKPMLAKDGDLSKITYPVVGQIKYDGIRALVVDGVVRSRTFKPIPNQEIQAALGKPEFEGLDGEIIVGFPEDEGCMQRTTSFVMAPGKIGECWTFYAFDLWNHPGSYIERREALWDIEVPGFIYRVGGTHLANVSELEAFEANALAQGHEGIIVRDPKAPYKHGRSGVKGPLLKVKRFIDFEAEILDVYEEQHNANEATKDAFGRTERSTKKEGKQGKDTLGGFELVATNGPHKDQQFRCGTGFTREQRKEFWEAFHATPVGPGRYRARVAFGTFTAKIKSFPVGVKDAPRFPVFLGFRDMELDG